MVRKLQEGLGFGMATPKKRLYHNLEGQGDLASRNNSYNPYDNPSYPT